MNRRIIIGLAIALGIVLTWWAFSGPEGGNDIATAQVQKGTVEVSVSVTGELQAKESEKIMGPPGMRQANIWRTNITDMVDEGTVVDSGDYIATLDRTELADKLKNLYSELEKTESQFIAQKLDTSLNLRTARDELVNLQYAMEEKKLIHDQSKYEAPAVQRQAQIDMEKAKRQYEQTVENYQLKRKQAEAKTSEVYASYSQIKNSYEFTQNLLGKFEITAPKGGMLIYHRDWDGEKVQVGSAVSTWNPIVATLPNLDKMISVTYVNEVDISKIKKGQRVSIGIDAFQGKTFDGIITDVANVGEQMDNTDAKVFEVVIELSESDTILRPAMTTSNEIHVGSFEESLYLPIEAVYSFGKLKAVYQSSLGGMRLKEVKTGPSNDNQIIIEEGLENGENVLIVPIGTAEVNDTLRLSNTPSA